MWILYVILWFLSGFIGFLIITFQMNKGDTIELTVSDITVGIGLTFFGIVSLLLCCIASVLTYVEDNKDVVKIRIKKHK